MYKSWIKNITVFYLVYKNDLNNDTFCLLLGFKKKTPTIWKTMHSSKQEEPMIVTITGKQKSVNNVKEKVKKHFNSPQVLTCFASVHVIFWE